MSLEFFVNYVLDCSVFQFRIIYLQYIYFGKPISVIKIENTLKFILDLTELW